MAGTVNAAGGALWGITIAVSFIIAFFGYRFLRPTMAASSFMLVGSVVFSIIYSTTDSLIGAWISFLGTGALAALAAWFLRKLGVFFTGGCAGLSLGLLVFSAGLYSSFSKDWLLVMWLSVGIGALLMAVLTLVFERFMLIIGTSLIGSYYFLRSIGFFAGSYPFFDRMQVELWEPIENKEYPSLPYSFWIYFGLTMGLWAVSTLIQFLVTAKGIDHRVPTSTFKAEVTGGDGTETSTPQTGAYTPPTATEVTVLENPKASRIFGRRRPKATLPPPAAQALPERAMASVAPPSPRRPANVVKGQGWNLV